jgi:hypothetical protein
MQQFNYRIGNIEARTAPSQDTLEIVQWNEKHCWAIVTFCESRDTGRWNALFVGDRPFDPHVNWQHLRILIQASYAYLQQREEQSSE